MKTLNTLADLRPEVRHLDVACSRYERRGRLNVARLIEQHGFSATLCDAVAGINGDCPNAAAHSLMERCDVYFPGLGGMLSSG